jgi:hypothetical protein
LSIAHDGPGSPLVVALSGEGALVGDAASTAAFSATALMQARPTAPSGVYWFDPDGAGGRAAFRSYADLTRAGGGWMQVRRVRGSGGWYPGDDNLSGTGSFEPSAVGERNADRHGSVQFDYFVDGSTEYLFATGDEAVWCVLQRGSGNFGATAEPGARGATVLYSRGTAVAAGGSTNVLLRAGTAEDPWIGCEGDHNANLNKILYGENAFGESNPTAAAEFLALKNQGNRGINIFVRAGGRQSLRVIKEGSGTGRVTSNRPGIDCGPECAAGYTSNSTVVLTAVADTGSVFTGWSGGGCTGTDPCSVMMNEPKTRTAIFTLAAGAPVISVSPGALSFGGQAVGTTSSAQTLTIGNTGTGTLTINSLSVTGTPAQFAVASGGSCGTLPRTLAAAATCTVNVTLAPSSTGAQTAQLSVGHSLGTSIVELSGLGTDGSSGVDVSPVSIDFGIGAHTVASTRTVTLTNSGSTALAAPTISAVGGNHASDFSISSNSCISSLPPGESCAFQVTFSATDVNERIGHIRVAHARSGSPVTISLYGVGSRFRVCGELSDCDNGIVRDLGTLPAGALGGVFRVLTITNTGSATVTMKTPVLFGSGRREFEIDTASTCITSSTVAPGGSCTVGVRYAPSATGNAQATLRLGVLGGDGGMDVPLSGRSRVPFHRMNFGKQPTATTPAAQALTVTNNATHPITLQLKSAVLSGSNPSEFSVVNDPSKPCTGSMVANATGTVAAGDFCRWLVSFVPGADGASRSAIFAFDLTDRIDGGANTTSEQTIFLDGEPSSPAGKAVLGITPSPADFGTSSGETKDLVLTISNVGGTAPLTLGSSSVRGADRARFAQTATTCGSSVAPDASCTRTYRFTPPAGGGTQSASLYLAHNVTASYVPLTFSAFRSGGSPAIFVSRSFVGFGSQAPGTSSPIQRVTITNVGAAPLNLTSSVAGEHASQFLVGGNCPATLADFRSCTLEVSFRPTSEGVKQAGLVITNSATGSEPVVVDLGGVTPGATYPTFEVSEGSVVFGTVSFGSSAERTVTVRNFGTAGLTVTSVSGSGDFAVVSQTCTGTTIAPSGTCSIVVRFAPTANGVRGGLVSVVHNAAATPTTVEVSGTGTGATVTISGTVSGASGPLTLSNPGSTDLMLTSGGPFSFTVSQGASYQVTVTTPPAGQSCTVSGGGPGTAAANVSGVSVACSNPPTTMSLAPTTVAIGTVALGSSAALRLVTVTTPGTLFLSGITLGAGPFAIDSASTTCSTGTPITGSCVIGVRFAPTTTGSFSATLTVSGNAPSATVAFTGEGVAQPVIVVERSTLAFGESLVGNARTTSSAERIIVRNVGEAELPANSITLSMSGNHPQDFSEGFSSTLCSAALQANAVCEIPVTFRPSGPGQRSAYLSVSHTGWNTSESPWVAAVSGFGAEVQALKVCQDGNDCESGQLQFASVAQGNTQTRTLTLENVDAASSNSSVTVGTGNKTFTLEVGPVAAGSTLAPGPGRLVRAQSTSDAAVWIEGSVTSYSPSTRTLVINATSFSGSGGVSSWEIAPVLAIDTVDVVGPGRSEYAASAVCNGRVLRLGESCALPVEFTPTAFQRTPMASLLIRYTGSGGQQELALRGRSLVSTNSIAFGNVPNGSIQTLDIFIKNNLESGLVRINCSEQFFSGDGAFGFTIVPGCTAGQTRELGISAGGVGEELTVRVELLPGSGAAGPRTATLRLRVRGSDRGTDFDDLVEVPLSGTVVPATDPAAGRAQLALDGGAVNLQFPATNVNPATPTTVTGRLRNQGVVGSRSASVSAISIGGPDAAEFFGQIANGRFDADISWTKGGSWTISEGRARKSGTGDSLLSQQVIGGLVPDARYRLTYDLTRTAGQIRPRLGGGGAVVQGVQRTADGSYAEILVAQSGNTTLEFDANPGFNGSIDNVQLLRCGDATLAAGSTCEFSLNFAPRSAGLRSAYLRVQHDATGAPRIFPLSAIANGGAVQIKVFETELRFGAQRPGSSAVFQGVSVGNVGTLPAEGVLHSLSGQWQHFTVDNVCTATIIAEYAFPCQVSVGYTPQSDAPETATAVLTLTAVPGGGSRSITLIGLRPGAAAPSSTAGLPAGVSTAAVTALPLPVVPLPGDPVPMPRDEPTALAVALARIAPSGASAPTEPASASLAPACGAACGPQPASVESVAEDGLAGSVYRLLRRPAAQGMQEWLLEYRSNTGLLFAHAELPTTTPVSWRREAGVEVPLPTSGWTRVCGDRVWVAQDGYQLLAHVVDRGLVELRRAPLNDSRSAAAVDVLEAAECASDGGLRLSGYTLGVGSSEPPLADRPVPASRFELILDRSAVMTRRTTRPDSLDLRRLCSSPANEHHEFCAAARQAVGW